MKEEIVVTYFIVAITMHSVSKLAFDFTYPPELLDENIQDIFPNVLNAYSNMKGYDPEEAFEMFIFVICHFQGIFFSNVRLSFSIKV